MDWDGGNRTVLKDWESPIEARYSNWSPDGEQIAFALNFNGGAYGIYVIDAKGGDETRISDVSANDEWPTWSPDGTRIAFVSYRDGDGEIYVMDAGGRNASKLTREPSSADENPAWSP
jgi:Tol biopolymer transport system component